MPTRKSPTNPARIAAILDTLQQTYPNAVCALHHKSAWQLLVATILSAQCTDVRVNLVTPALFKAFPTPKAMAAASLPELEALIRTTGFFRNKAKSLQGAGRIVTEEFHGKVPPLCPTSPHPRRRPQDRQRRPRLMVQDRRRHRRGHARPAHLPPPAAH